MNEGHERVELRMRGRLTPRMVAAFSGMRVSETVETTLVMRLADDDAGRRLLRAVERLGVEILEIKAIDDGSPG